MSFPRDRICPVPGCRFNNHVTKADSEQMKDHIKQHGYKYLRQAAIALELIEVYSQPKTEDLVGMLTRCSLIGSLPNA